jgi:hypothetical protein
MPHNDAYIELCHMTTAIVDKARAAGATEYTREEGFREACRQRPDLASRADDGRRPVARRGNLNRKPATADESPLVRVCKNLNR